jgi:hypothetical protein
LIAAVTMLASHSVAISAQVSCFGGGGLNPSIVFLVPGLQ